MPNVKFGFTSRHLECHNTEGALRTIPKTKILLESDAPYLSSVSRRDVNTPRAINPVARRIAEVKGVSQTIALAKTLPNLECVYRI